MKNWGCVLLKHRNLSVFKNKVILYTNYADGFFHKAQLIKIGGSFTFCKFRIFVHN